MRLTASVLAQAGACPRCGRVETMKGFLQIGPRYVKQDADSLRPFQRQALEAIKNSDARLIFIEAPVGVKWLDW